MTDLTPPPDEPVDPAARARMREQVLTGLCDPAPRSRWLVPIAAAAAVAVLAGVTGYVALGGDDEQQGVGPAATASPSATQAAPSSTPSAADPPTTHPESESRTRLDHVAACTEQLGFVLEDADPMISFAQGSVVGTFYVKGDRWALCDLTPETTTIQGVARLDAPYVDDVTPWQVSTNVTDYTAKHMVQVFVAGGPLPEGVTGIDYAFADGQTQRAQIRTDDTGREWWRMEYVATEGVLSDPSVNQTTIDPIEVTVSLSGVQDTYTLQWGIDTCAQVNHGC